MTVLVYRDEGVGELPAKETFGSLNKALDATHHSVKYVDHQYLRDEAWESRASALVIPGGRDLPYHRLLAGHTNAKIRRFVENGGSYLGICAGAYYGCSQFEFEKGNPLEICADRELGFFPGMARGPALGKGIFDYESERGARIPAISWSRGDQLLGSIYYNGGCLFEKPEAFPHVSVLGRYETIAERPAAIILCRVGLGIALLSGVHPEIGVPADGFLSELYPYLQRSEEFRLKIWHSMLELLGLKLNLASFSGVR